MHSHSLQIKVLVCKYLKVQLLFHLFHLWPLSARLEPLEKIINLSESTKNKILTAEGFLLLLCVLLPAATLICQVRRSHDYDWLYITLPLTCSIELMVNFQNFSTVLLPYHSCQHTENYCNVYCSDHTQLYVSQMVIFLCVSCLSFMGSCTISQLYQLLFSPHSQRD